MQALAFEYERRLQNTRLTNIDGKKISKEMKNYIYI